MKRLLPACLLLTAAVIAGCSGLKTYPNAGEKNLLIRTKTSGSLFLSVQAYLHIYSLKGECKGDYLGSFKLKNGETDVALPAGRPLFLRFIFRTDTGIAPYPVVLTPEAGARYTADVQYADRIYNVTMREAGPKGKHGRELDLKSRDCPDIGSR